jgi:hypothetical protein
MNVKRDGIIGRQMWLRSSAEIGRAGGKGMPQINSKLAIRWEALACAGDFARFLERQSTMLLENTCESNEGTREESEVKTRKSCLANRKKLD